MSEAQEHLGCPLNAVHKRLEDLHRHWHAAAEAYFDPEAFRVAVQVAIQTARTVSFILQSNKHVFPNFDTWYEPWQRRFRDDPLMRWMVDARNRIEKQGDLEAHSKVRAEIIASYLNAEVPRVEVPADLSSAPLALLKSIPKGALGEHIRKQGFLRIQRRWVENTLPDYELLDAVACAYGQLSQLLDDAHRALGLRVPETTDTHTGEVYDGSLRNGRMPCMIGHGDFRSLDLSLADGRPIRLVNVEREVDVREMEMAAKRYELQPQETFAGGHAEEVLQSLYATARKMFLKDGHHITIVFLLRQADVVSMREVVFEEHGQKYLFMRELANEVVRRGADAVIMIGEIWMARYDPKNSYRRAVEAPDRREALAATLITQLGDPIELHSMIERATDGVSLSELTEKRDGAHFMFAPIYAAWGREVPKEWSEQLRTKDNGR